MERIPAAVIDKLCEALAAGNHRTTSCVYAKLSYSLFEKWMKAGESEEGTGSLADEFRWKILQAEVRPEIIATSRLIRSNDIQAFKWWLERRHGGRWARRARKAKEDQRLQRELMKQDTDRLLELLEDRNKK